MPHTSSGQIEQRSGNSVSRDTCDPAEDDHVHYDRQGGLDDKPDRTEDGLLVLGDDVALDEKGDEVSVLPEFLQVNLKEVILGLDDSGPLLRRLCFLIHS